MALIHKATVVPGKLELITPWLPTRSWYAGPAEPTLTRIAAARLDDPAGEVGIEIMIIRVGDGPLLHVPVTYRGAPLADAEEWLIGTTEHTVLGSRWVYDAVGDPVYAAQLTEIIRTAGREAIEEVDTDGELVRREPDLALHGSGADTPALDGIIEVTDGEQASIGTATHELTVLRVLGPVPPSGAVLADPVPSSGAVLPGLVPPSGALLAGPVESSGAVLPGPGPSSGAVLTGTWDGSPVVLAALTPR